MFRIYGCAGERISSTQRKADVPGGPRSLKKNARESTPRASMVLPRTPSSPERPERKPSRRGSAKIGAPTSSALDLLLALHEFVKWDIEQAGEQFEGAILAPVLTLTEIGSDGFCGFREVRD